MLHLHYSMFVPAAFTTMAEEGYEYPITTTLNIPAIIPIGKCTQTNIGPKLPLLFFLFILPFV